MTAHGPEVREHPARRTGVAGGARRSGGDRRCRRAGRRAARCQDRRSRSGDGRGSGVRGGHHRGDPRRPARRRHSRGGKRRASRHLRRPVAGGPVGRHGQLRLRTAGFRGVGGCRIRWRDRRGGDHPTLGRTLGARRCHDVRDLHRCRAFPTADHETRRSAACFRCAKRRGPRRGRTGVFRSAICHIGQADRAGDHSGRYPARSRCADRWLCRVRLPGVGARRVRRVCRGADSRNGTPPPARQSFSPPAAPCAA